MPAAPIIAQLLIAYGPMAYDLIQKLAALWSKPQLTVEEFNSVMAVVPRKTLAEYLAEAGAASRPTTPTA
jgi:hypothetical protein